MIKYMNDTEGRLVEMVEWKYTKQKAEVSTKKRQRSREIIIVQ